MQKHIENRGSDRSSICSAYVCEINCTYIEREIVRRNIPFTEAAACQSSGGHGNTINWHTPKEAAQSCWTGRKGVHMFSVYRAVNAVRKTKWLLGRCACFPALFSNWIFKFLEYFSFFWFLVWKWELNLVCRPRREFRSLCVELLIYEREREREVMLAPFLFRYMQ